MNDVIITKGKPDDLGLFLMIDQQFSESTNPSSFFEECLQNKAALLAYNKKKELLGFLLFQIFWGNTPFLALLKVIPNAQGKGVGSALLNSFEKEMQQQKFSFYMSSTEESNDEGISFHQKKGFCESGRLNMPHGKEIFFQKQLIIDEK